MKIGVPREIKQDENRVGLTAEGVAQLTHLGHDVFVEKGAGKSIGISDESYLSSGAVILDSLQEVYKNSNLIVKIKEPQDKELPFISSKHTLFTFLHLAANRKLTKALMDSGATCIAYETVQLEDGSLPILTPMSEIAGRMAVQVGVNFLQTQFGGKGVLPGGVPGVKRGKVVVLGAGTAGQGAIMCAVGIGAEVSVLDLDMRKLRHLEDIYRNRISTLYSSSSNIEKEIKKADLIVGTVLIPGAKAPKLIKKGDLKKLEPGTVLVDVSIDQGGCFELSHPTTHSNPIFKIEDTVFYCVANMPGAFARTSTYALTNISLKYVIEIAEKGVEEACRSKELFHGVNIYKGKLVYKKIAEDLDLQYTSLKF